MADARATRENGVTFAAERRARTESGGDTKTKPRWEEGRAAAVRRRWGKSAIREGRRAGRGDRGQKPDQEGTSVFGTERRRPGQEGPNTCSSVKSGMWVYRKSPRDSPRRRDVRRPGLGLWGPSSARRRGSKNQTQQSSDPGFFRLPRLARPTILVAWALRRPFRLKTKKGSQLTS